VNGTPCLPQEELKQLLREAVQEAVEAPLKEIKTEIMSLKVSWLA
jgi:hypothetical protein